jgi:HK97 family phage portal protein
MPIFDTTDGSPVELGEGRGDLRYSSVPFGQLDGPFWNGRPVSYAKVFADQPWVAIAVMRLLTWAIRVPLKVYQRLDDDGARRRLRPDEHPLAAAVQWPWDGGSSADLVMNLLGPLCVHGNDLMDVQSGRSGKIQFDPLDWRQVTPIQLDDSDPNSMIGGWNVERGKTKFTRSSRTVMHLRWWSPLGQLGISPLQQIRSTVVAEAAAVDWTVNNLRRSVRPSGVVEVSDAALELSPENRRTLYQNAVEDVQSNFGGAPNAGKLPVLPPGLKWSRTDQTTAVEADLINQRFVNRNEVAAIYMIPPPTIGQLDRSTFNNITTLREMAYTDGLAPPLVLIESKLNAHVLHELLREDDVFVEFDFGAILRGDRLKEIEALRSAIGWGLMKPNEGRQVLNLPREDVEGADQLWLPQNNLSPIGQPPAPKKQPPAPPPVDQNPKNAAKAEEEILNGQRA